MRSLLYVLFALLASATAQKLEKMNTISDNMGKVYHYQPEQVHLAFGGKCNHDNYVWILMKVKDYANKYIALHICIYICLLIILYFSAIYLSKLLFK